MNYVILNDKFNKTNKFSQSEQFMKIGNKERNVLTQQQIRYAKSKQTKNL